LSFERLDDLRIEPARTRVTHVFTPASFCDAGHAEGTAAGQALTWKRLAEGPERAEHPRILRIDEPYLRPEELALHLEALRTATNNDDPVAVRRELERLVDSYRYAP
jgi:hypothetical protein